MDAAAFRRIHRRAVIDRLTEQVEHAAEARISDRHRNRSVQIARGRAAHQAVGRAHRNAANRIVSDLLRYLRNEFALGHIYFNRMEERRKFSLRKADVEHSAHHLNDFTYMLLTHQSFSFISA